MPAYLTRLQDLRLGDHTFQIRSLEDLQQFSDPDGAAERAGISSALWPLFGQVWPSGLILADAMAGHDVADKRILEVGCGLALSSLVLQRRHADITASDHHPLTSSFLEYNASLNGLPEIPYCDLPWDAIDDELGLFDLIIASDVLYERGHAMQLALLMERHASPRMEVIVADPGRGNGNAFSRQMADLGYGVSEERLAFEADEAAPFRGRLLTYRRSS